MKLKLPVEKIKVEALLIQPGVVMLRPGEANLTQPVKTPVVQPGVVMLRPGEANLTQPVKTPVIQQGVEIRMPVETHLMQLEFVETETGYLGFPVDFQ